MIKSFRSKALRNYWTRNDAASLPADHLKRLKLRLTALDMARSPTEMNVPGWRFHSLVGDQAGRFSVTVTGNWRLTFAWDEGRPAAVDVDYEDYH